jgi:hypothetical protein
LQSYIRTTGWAARTARYFADRSETLINVHGMAECAQTGRRRGQRATKVAGEMTDYVPLIQTTTCVALMVPACCARHAAEEEVFGAVGNA